MYKHLSGVEKLKKHEKMIRHIEIETYPNGVMGWCRWQNRKCYAFYDTKNGDFIFEIKAYFKGSGEDSFGGASSKRDVHKVSYRLTPETFIIFFECQRALLEYLIRNKIPFTQPPINQ